MFCWFNSPSPSIPPSFSLTLCSFVPGRHSPANCILVQRRGDGERVTSTLPTTTTAEAAAAALQKKPSEMMSAVASRFDGREDELNATVTHVNVKSSKGKAADGNAGAPDK